VGDFEQNQLDQLVDKYFGQRKNPEDQIKRVDVVEPERTQVERFEKTRPNVPLPALAMTYFAPPSDSEDIPAIEIAQAILADGESSRLYQELVYKQQLAQSAEFFADIRIDKGLLAFYAIAAGGKKLEDIEKAILAEIEKLQETGPTEKEVEKAKNKLITDILQQRQTVDGKAFAIGEAIIYKNNARAVNEDVAKLQAVTAQDVQNVLKKYLKENSRAVIYYRNGSEGEDK
ncbi:MAG: M16 family metallopeptidase, partial [Aridibacter sp.]